MLNTDIPPKKREHLGFPYPDRFWSLDHTQQKLLFSIKYEVFFRASFVNFYQNNANKDDTSSVSSWAVFLWLRSAAATKLKVSGCTHNAVQDSKSPGQAIKQTLVSRWLSKWQFHRNALSRFWFPCVSLHFQSFLYTYFYHKRWFRSDRLSGNVWHRSIHSNFSHLSTPSRVTT